MDPLAGPGAIKRETAFEAFKVRYPLAWYLVKRGALLGGAFLLGSACQYLPEEFQALCEALAKLFQELPL